MKFNSKIEKEFSDKEIDRDLTLSILESYNSKTLPEPVEVSELPEIDNRSIIDMKNLRSLPVQSDIYRSQFEKLLPEYSPDKFGHVRGDTVILERKELEYIGILLYPVTAFGILNGGSATSYIDIKKNRSFNPEIFELYKDIFLNLSELSRNKAKGITPAFTNPDGSAGPSFMELKLRGLLIEALKYRKITGKKAPALFPFFQMTSTRNNSQIREALERYGNSPMISSLAEETGIPITEALTGIQPLIAAYTPVEAGKPLNLFTEAWGKKDTLLPLPGGHGQNFFVLRDIYSKLYSDGKRFVYLGNIDNLGSTVDPVSLAVLALTGKQAAFDFSFKTSVDVKGGILVRDKTGKLNCADIGPAIPPEEVQSYESAGTRVLFNCATGIFSLDYLVPNIDMIIEKLPLRFSNQDKDAGKYSQAEQVTWEIMGLLDDFLILAVDKYDRFLAAKMLIESILTSGIRTDSPVFLRNDNTLRLKQLAENLNRGLKSKLSDSYGLMEKNGIWMPKPIGKL